MRSIKQNIALTIKLSFLLVVLGLLIGHGTPSGPNLAGAGGGEPCFPYNTTSVAYICIDGDDTTGDIAQLNGLTTVTGDLIIEETNLTNLEFLSNISVITGMLVIKNNPSITTISSMATLGQVNALRIEGNDSLVDLAGLNSLTTIPDTVYISDNTSLLSLSDLNIGAATTFVTVIDNTSLQDLAALSNLQNSTGGVGIQGNNLSNLNDLNSLTSVGGLSIGDKNIISLVGLGSLTSVSESLSVTNSANLTSLSGLTSVVLSDGLGLRIDLNSSLISLSGLPSIPATLSTLQVNSNGSLVDLSALSTVTTVTGIMNIAGNAAVSSLSSLANVQSVGIFSLQNNPALTSLGLSGLVTVEDQFLVDGNAMLCEQDATDLLNQVVAAGSVIERIIISNNLQVCL